MKFKTLQKTGDKLVFHQQDKAHNVTGVLLIVLGIITISLAWQGQLNKGIMLFAFAQWLLALVFFYKGAARTFTVDRTMALAERSVKGIFNYSKQQWKLSDVRIFLIAESSRFLQAAENCDFKLLMETDNGKRIRLFTFRSRPVCKKTMLVLTQFFKKEAQQSNLKRGNVSVLNKGIVS